MFDDAAAFNNSDYTFVLQDGEYYLIDKQMKRVSENFDCDFANSLSDNLFYVIKDGVKAAPHNYCRSIALSDFSADCTN